MGKKTLREVRVKDVEKRRFPNKHYAYVLEVSWSEGTSTVIYRRYSDFFEFQCELLERFPEEAGTKDPATRMIPFLPGKKLFGRSNVRTVAEKRKEKINEYCRALIRLPSKISDNPFVLEFFEVRQDDITPQTKQQKTQKPAPISEISDPILLERYVAIADYEKVKKNECSLMAGQTVEVIDKNQNGWWFVNVDDFNEGWVPATYLEPLYGAHDDEAHTQILSPGEEEVFITINKYSAQHHDEASFEKGVLVEVFEKGLDGWWKIRYQGKEGMAPAAYLQRYHGPMTEASNPAQVVSSVREAVQSASSSPSLHKAAESKPKLQPTWHSQPKPYVDKEPIYAPTPRRHSIKKKPLKKKVPVPIIIAAEAAAMKPRGNSPQSPISHPTIPSPSSPTDFNLDGPERVYEVIPEPEEQIYVAIADFTAGNAGDGLSFQAGASCSVITKNATGWWYVDMSGKEGWVPSSYLERKHSKPNSPLAKLPSPTSLVTPSQSKSIGGSWAPVEVKKSKQQGQTKKNFDMFNKSTSSLTRSTQSSNSVTQPKRSSLKRTSSTGSIEYDKPVIPKFHRSQSPPAVVKPAQQTFTSHLNRHPKRPSAPSLTVKSEKSSPRTIRRSADDGRPQPVPRKVNVSKTMSAGGDATKPARRNPATLQQGGAKSSLELPTTHSHRSPSVGAAPSRRENGVSPTSRHELEKAINQRTTLHTTSLGGIKRTSPQKPRPPPSPSDATRKRILPKRPEPPKQGAKKMPPPRPLSSPATKRKEYYITISDYPGDATGCLSFKEGELVEVIEKSSDGWWYIQIGSREGWAPSTFLEEKSSDPKPKPLRPTRPPVPKTNQAQDPPMPKPRVRTNQPSSNTYRAVATYEVPIYEDSGLPLEEGRLYQVVDKSDSGWWFVRDGDREGWAPASYFDPA